MYSNYKNLTRLILEFLDVLVVLNSFELKRYKFYVVTVSAELLLLLIIIKLRSIFINSYKINRVIEGVHEPHQHQLLCLTPRSPNSYRTSSGRSLINKSFIISVCRGEQLICSVYDGT